jgi:membrane protease YdiL (CAAX protease family)
VWIGTASGSSIDRVTTRTTKSLALLLSILAGPILAQAPIDIENDFAPGTHKRFAERVNKGQSSIYADVLAAYDARLSKYPDDFASNIERCRFIETFAYSEEGTIASSPDDLDACREQLKTGPHAAEVDVILYGVESAWDDAKAQEAKELIPQSRAWSVDQQATLFELLTDKFRWKEPELAGQYAMRAVGLRPGSRVLITAVERWIQLGAKDRARRLIVDAPASTWELVPRFSAAKLLVDIGDPKAAAALMQGDEKNAGNSIMLARILAETGEIKAAREIYRAAVKEQYVAYDSRVEYFDFERRHGGRDAAIAAYAQLRDQGFGADILGRQRLSLFFAYPSAAWHWQDAWGVLLFLGLLLLFAAIPVVAIAPVHYRGLARRVAGIAPDKTTTTWTLRHSWYALGVIWVGGGITLYVFGAAALELMLPWTKRLEASFTDIELGKQLLCANVIALLLLVPLLRGRSLKSLMLGRWSIVKSIFAGIGLAIALKIVAIVFDLGVQSFGALGTDTTRAMQGMHQSYGLAGMLLIMAVAVPLVEELVFRGVTLEAFRGHVSFMFAAILQAATFAVIHESPADMPFLFLYGLVAAWLVKRSEGLLAPVAMHSAFNFTAAVTLVGLTSVLNR